MSGGASVPVKPTAALWDALCPGSHQRQHHPFPWCWLRPHHPLEPQQVCIHCLNGLLNLTHMMESFTYPRDTFQLHVVGLSNSKMLCICVSSLWPVTCHSIYLNCVQSQSEERKTFSAVVLCSSLIDEMLSSSIKTVHIVASKLRRPLFSSLQ